MKHYYIRVKAMGYGLCLVLLYFKASGRFIIFWFDSLTALAIGLISWIWNQVFGAYWLLLFKLNRYNQIFNSAQPSNWQRFHFNTLQRSSAYS